MATTMTLAQLRTAIRQRADMENSTFVSDTELNSYINQSYFELYDLLIQAYGNDYFVASPYAITTDGTNQLFNLPADFYKLLGVDLAISTGSYVSLKPFAFAERNNSVIPSSGQSLQLWYAPRLTPLASDSDTMDGISGWTEYVICDGAIKCGQKEETDVSVLMAQKNALLGRISAASENRDAGSPATVADASQPSNMCSLRYRLNGSKLWLLQMNRITYADSRAGEPFA